MDVNIVSIKRSLPLQLFSKNSFDLLMSMLNHASSKKMLLLLMLLFQLLLSFVSILFIRHLMHNAPPHMIDSLLNQLEQMRSS